MVITRLVDTGRSAVPNFFIDWAGYEGFKTRRAMLGLQIYGGQNFKGKVKNWAKFIFKFVKNFKK
jgi:hypothetical protein